jgi:diketogulonate reductase-like aldo/keto reductase
MEERRLGPVVGLGTWNTFDRDASLAAEIVEAAFAAGTRLVDSSPMYGGAEASLSRAHAARRAEGIVATKIWSRHVEDGREHFARQLVWFGRVDVEQVHNLVSWREHLPWLEEERAAGRIDRLGVTHYSPAAFDELLPLAEQLGAAVIVMRPLGEGSLMRRPPAPEELTPLEPFGVRTWAQALLKWALSDPRVDVVIPATTNPDHARSNAAAGEPPWFGPDERRLVERLADR